MVGSGVLKEKIMKAVFFTTACISILAVGLICFFLFVNGTPAIKEIGVIKFLFGKVWRPGNGDFGILPMIVGSLYVTARIADSDTFTIVGRIMMPSRMLAVKIL